MRHAACFWWVRGVLRQPAGHLSVSFCAVYPYQHMSLLSSCHPSVLCMCLPICNLSFCLSLPPLTTYHILLSLTVLFFPGSLLAYQPPAISHPPISGRGALPGGGGGGRAGWAWCAWRACSSVSICCAMAWRGGHGFGFWVGMGGHKTAAWRGARCSICARHNTRIARHERHFMVTTPSLSTWHCRAVVGWSIYLWRTRTRRAFRGFVDVLDGLVAGQAYGGLDGVSTILYPIPAATSPIPHQLPWWLHTSKPPRAVYLLPWFLLHTHLDRFSRAVCARLVPHACSPHALTCSLLSPSLPPLPSHYPPPPPHTHTTHTAGSSSLSPPSPPFYILGM